MDESTILRFERPLELHQLSEKIFAQIRALLEDKRLLLKPGAIVDATIIEAPTSTKDAEGERDPEMHQVVKVKEWHFGMKAHVGTDRHGIVHTLTTTAASVADITEMYKLLHGKEKEIFGDQGYWSKYHRQGAKRTNDRYRVNRRRTGQSALSAHRKLINRIRSRASALRTPLSGRQTSVGLYQSAPPRARKEHCKVVHGLCAGESVPATTKADAIAGKVSVVRADRTPCECQHVRDGSHNCLRKPFQ